MYSFFPHETSQPNQSKRSCLLNQPNNIFISEATQIADHGLSGGITPAEVRWHYSQHFLAECRGEEIIEDLVAVTYGRKQRNLLYAQLKDEIQHVRLFSAIVSKIGLDPRANRFADGYAAVVRAQRSLTEKIFAFQILTEAVSAAYCEWRLSALGEFGYSSADREVLADETRHLGMGRSMLMICDEDETAAILTVERKRQLIRMINSICYSASNIDMPNAVFGESSGVRLPHLNSLNSLVSRTVVRESGLNKETQFLVQKF